MSLRTIVLIAASFIIGIACIATGSTDTFAQTDRFTDVGFDTQYQYQGNNYWLTLRGSFIREFQAFNASFNGFN